MPDHPEEITRVVAESGLGEIVGRYRQSVLGELIGLPFVAVLGGGLMFGNVVGKTIGAAIFGLGVASCLAAWVKARRYLYLCSGGLLTTSNKVTVRTICAWTDVLYIRVWTLRTYSQYGTQDVPRCILMREDGTKVNLARPPYAKGRELIRAVEQLVTPTLYARRTAEIEETGATEFGPITVTAEGLRDGDRSVRWSDITGMELGRVRLRVWAGWGPPAISRQVRGIEDVRVLTALVVENCRSLSEPLQGS
ncbi:hypothetical protein Skr01_53240 [Sphaerisporangium krabiense]|uniref:Uncharacterized protein n=1 Tax=Sphaerisporangium krabiense TaxID=763782 RepID=A0A7W9DR65_9ACTN|nr:DUF6585 family protein [Sphaerisporangium krabiense]MBB5627085.1 hypothetical protein [Sphaerisporangium krabiense]GII65239.1 hypothetical protein Skr01_53240 [Sphaerisporangium krabiense]